MMEILHMNANFWNLSMRVPRGTWNHGAVKTEVVE